jgi:hypothetical protein
MSVVGTSAYQLIKFIMQTTMLEYSKTILKKVSFCDVLFEKELRKAIRWLIEREKLQLQVWCKQHFGARYSRIINKCFTRRLLIRTRQYTARQVRKQLLRMDN